MTRLVVLSDAELALLDVALRSGLRIRPRDQADDAVVAVTVDQMLRAEVAGELDRREVEVPNVVMTVVAKALKALPPEL